MVQAFMASRLVSVEAVSYSKIYATVYLILDLADTRTDQPLLLGHALLQHQHIGVLPTSTEPLRVLPLQDVSSTSMPEAWVR